jgi:hypothetical protein
MPRKIVSVLVLSLVAGCGEDRGAAGDSPSTDAGGTPVQETGPVVDTSDPFDVAEAFFDAVDEGDYTDAARWVLPEQQEGFLAAMQEESFELPDEYEVVVMAQGEYAGASIVGTEIGVDMDLVDGRWWISN